MFSVATLVRRSALEGWTIAIASLLLAVSVFEDMSCAAMAAVPNPTLSGRSIFTLCASETFRPAHAEGARRHSLRRNSSYPIAGVNRPMTAAYSTENRNEHSRSPSDAFRLTTLSVHGAPYVHTTQRLSRFVVLTNIHFDRHAYTYEAELG